MSERKWTTECRAQITLPDDRSRQTPRRSAAAGRLQERGPKWVISGPGEASSTCPLLPRKQTLRGAIGMSSLCQKPASGLLYSIISSASNCIEIGASMPSALAVLRSISSSNFVASWTGRSGGHSSGAN